MTDPKHAWKLKEYHKSSSGKEYSFGELISSDKAEELKPEIQEAEISISKDDKENEIEELKAQLEMLSKMVMDGAKKGEQPNMNNLASEIAKAINKDETGYTPVEQIDEDDIQDVTVTFSSYGQGYVIVDKLVGGQPVMTPYKKPMKFKFQASRSVKVGRYHTYSAICTYSTNSKKEIAWLKSHPMFGYDFFVSTGAAMNASVTAASIAARIYKVVNNLDQQEIFRRAKSMGIKLGEGLDVIRALLIDKMIKQEAKNILNNDTNSERARLEKFTFDN